MSNFRTSEKIATEQLGDEGPPEITPRRARIAANNDDCSSRYSDRSSRNDDRSSRYSDRFERYDDHIERDSDRSSRYSDRFECYDDHIERDSDRSSRNDDLFARDNDGGSRNNGCPSWDDNRCEEGMNRKSPSAAVILISPPQDTAGLTSSIFCSAALSSVSVPGVGAVLSATLLAEMRELGHVTRQEIGALAGVAPYNCHSGRFKGKRSFRGGRACVRCVLYMASVAAIRCNPVINAFAERFKAAGKRRKPSGSGPGSLSSPACESY